jgi:hypothetical protein
MSTTITTTNRTAKNGKAKARRARHDQPATLHGALPLAHRLDLYCVWRFGAAAGPTPGRRYHMEGRAIFIDGKPAGVGVEGELPRGVEAVQLGDLYAHMFRGDFQPHVADCHTVVTTTESAVVLDRIANDFERVVDEAHAAFRGVDDGNGW